MTSPKALLVSCHDVVVVDVEAVVRQSLLSVRQARVLFAIRGSLVEVTFILILRSVLWFIDWVQSYRLARRIPRRVEDGIGDHKLSVLVAREVCGEGFKENGLLENNIRPVKRTFIGRKSKSSSYGTYFMIYTNKTCKID